MYKYFGALLFGISYLFFYSCAEGVPPGNSAQFDTCKLTIISPYGCIHIIELNYSGFGSIKSGTKDASISNEIVGIDSLFLDEQIHITTEADLDLFRRLVLAYKSTPLIKSGRKYDVYRFQIFIDGVRRLDIFGNTEELNKLLDVLKGYLPISKDKCDFFKFYKTNEPVN